MATLNCSKIVAQYPNFTRLRAGGAEVAWHHPTTRGGYILITRADGPGIPSARATRVTVGRYTAKDTLVGGPSILIPVRELEAWIDKQLGLAG